ncbi:activating signal cointegrator 1 complex subunit 2 [Phycodurus eques]|uniref:activating signal cointegrator 1 complex subunit 2 n=1 Tax=Phycodurus eques TaxID=693459 RepID=UPI002ACE996C|nr:activating signal cointegrator 1 complex subunit 2 [Phycodurus eques]XP_061528697.1 activating signal cointegrator 1 complex subunit 2 [Phycodurus eques]
MACARVPLDEQQVTERDALGKERSLPALHPDRKEERFFMPYLPLSADPSPAEVEEFLERGRFILEDLEWLLTLPHDKFWCQVVFDTSLQKCLDSYVHHAPRGLDLAPVPLSPVAAESQRALHRAVFFAFLRMATHKESTESFITPAVFGEVLYENYLFDVPKMMDLCMLFGKGNAQLLHKMIENIFTQQPSYYRDLDDTVPTILEVFDTIEGKCGLHCDAAAAAQPMKLNARKQLTAISMTQQDFVDIVLYLCDTSSTLHAFLNVFPAACATFHSHSFLCRLTSFYESVVPDLEKALKKRNFEDKSLREDAWRRLSHSCRRMLETAHLLLHHTCLQPILEGVENMQIFAEELLQHFTSFLSEKRFLCDYDKLFPIAEDVSLLQQALPVIDETRTSYLLHGVHSAWDSMGRCKPQPTVSSSQLANQEIMYGASISIGQDVREAEGVRESPKGAEAMLDAPRKGSNGAICPVSEAELESLLTCIRDLLPDLGEGFLIACLQEYGYDSEVVINNILEGQLAPGLDALDRGMPRPVKETLPGVLCSRYNVFDDDEFDVFRRDRVDMTRVWKGRRKGESVEELLNDKQHISEQRARYQAYQTVVDEVELQAEDVAGGAAGASASYGMGDQYDDEYDDTYDMNQVGANDLDGDSLLNRRPFTLPRVLQRANKAEEAEDEEYHDKDQGLQSNMNRDQFIQDPALLRERVEAKRAAMQQRKGIRPERPSHVVGCPKGQGQTLDTFLDRRKKEANKGRGANHNRRNMADRKRNKGMIPS